MVQRRGSRAVGAVVFDPGRIPARRQYDQGAAAQFLAVGDYFLVSQALSLGYTVVTHEEPAPLGKKRIKIPDACNAAGVPWMPPWLMLRDEGARFRL